MPSCKLRARLLCMMTSRDCGFVPLAWSQRSWKTIWWLNAVTFEFSCLANIFSLIPQESEHFVHYCTRYKCLPCQYPALALASVYAWSKCHQCHLYIHSQLSGAFFLVLPSGIFLAKKSGEDRDDFDPSWSKLRVIFLCVPLKSLFPNYRKRGRRSRPSQIIRKPGRDSYLISFDWEDSGQTQVTSCPVYGITPETLDQRQAHIKLGEGNPLRVTKGTRQYLAGGSGPIKRMFQGR